MRRRREERRRRARWKVWWVLIATTAVGLVAVWLIRGALRVSPEIDDQLCPSDSLITEEVTLVLDATDEWSDVRELAIRRKVESIRESVKRFARISVHVVEPSDEPGSTARLTVCNPGSLEQIRDDSREYQVPSELVSNEDLVVSYRARFRSLIDSVVADVAAVQEQATSPIIETIRQAVLTSPGEPPSEIYLVSDMYQNSDLYSAYTRNVWDLQVADSLADVYIQGTEELAGAEVTIFLLSPADATPNPDAIRQFWDRYFAQQGAVLRRMERVEG